MPAAAHDLPRPVPVAVGLGERHPDDPPVVAHDREAGLRIGELLLDAHDAVESASDDLGAARYLWPSRIRP
jgi:hypothetical protein